MLYWVASIVFQGDVQAEWRRVWVAVGQAALLAWRCLPGWGDLSTRLQARGDGIPKASPSRR